MADREFGRVEQDRKKRGSAFAMNRLRLLLAAARNVCAAADAGRFSGEGTKREHPEIEALRRAAAAALVDLW